MKINPAIAALQRSRAPQRQAQAAMFAVRDAWRTDPGVTPVLEAFEAFGRGAELESCPALAGLFHDPDMAFAFVEKLVVQFSTALVREPFGQPPLRHGLAEGHATLLLARSGRAQLILHGGEPGRSPATTAHFSDAERYETVLAGRARALAVRWNPKGHIDAESLELRPGTCLRMNLWRESVQVLEIEQQMVALRLQRTVEEPRPSREYSLDDGTLLHQSAADMRASRHEMMLALLGRMERGEAAPVMAEMAREQGSESLRWQALRECLALDTVEGFRALTAIARREGDPLAAPAGALRAQLVEAHPELLSLEDDQCHA